MWKRRPDEEELNRNRRDFRITDEEMRSASSVFDMLANRDDPLDDQNMEFIRTTENRWSRYRSHRSPVLKRIRLVFEVIPLDRVIIWRMILRRDGQTYARIKRRYREVYPRRNRHRRDNR